MKELSYSLLKKRGMNGTIREWIELYKKKEDDESLLKLIEKFQPLIQKYAKKFPSYLREDVQQELLLALIESVQRIENYEKEGQCVKYIATAVQIRFFELCRRIKHRGEIEEVLEAEIKNQKYQNEDDYEKTEFLMDLRTMVNSKNMTQLRIAEYILSVGLTDREIAIKLNVSRQYVNRCKKEIFSKLKEYHKN